MKKLLLLYLFVFGLTVSGHSQNLNVIVSGSGPKIILIPGLASSGEVWAETVIQLSRTHECHVLTLPGFGTNPSAKEQEFLPIVESLVSEYIEKQGEPVILIGHSLGGFLSLKLSRSHPDFIKKAIIVDSFPFYSAAMNPLATESNMREMAGQMRQMITGLSEDQYRDQQEASAATMTTNAEKSPLLIKWSLESDRSTIAQAMYELMTTDYRSELSEVKTPLLVLGAWYSAKNYGMTEEMARKTFEDQYRLASSVQIEMAPTAHHFIMWDNPEWFMQQVESFL
jgi:pimeloyl-ACP methyl ester carboxylesterase